MGVGSGGNGPFVYANPNPEQSVDMLSDFATNTRLRAPNSSAGNANALNFSVWFVGEPPDAQDTLNYALIGKSNSVTSSAQGWNLYAVTGGVRLRVVTDSGAYDSPETGFAGSESGGLSIIHAVVSSGVMRMYKSAVLQDGTTTISGSIVTSNWGLALGCYNSGNPFAGGFVAAGIAGALSDAQVEAHYQAVLLDATAAPPGATNQWLAGDLSGSVLPDAIGSIDLDETGTITTTSPTIRCNHRFDPADAALSDEESPLIANTAGLLDVMLVGDSITNGAGSATGAGYVDGIAALASGSGDFDELALVGPNATSAAGERHDGNNGWTVGDHLDGDGTPADAIDALLAVHEPSIVSILLGANNATSGGDALAASGMADYMTLARLVGDTGARLVCMPPTRKDQGALNAQIDALAAFIVNQAVPTLRDEGYFVTTCNPYSAISQAAGDFDDGTHPNDQGYAILDDLIYAGIRRASGRA